MKNRWIKKRVSSIDVAELAGVSQSAVSRVFTPNGSVSEKTKNKVLAAADRLGYHPNFIAKSLIQQSTKLIAIVMVRFENPFYSIVLGRFTRKLEKLGYCTLIWNITHAREIEQTLPMALQYQVEGIFITSATLSSRMVDSCVRSGTPVVLFNRYTSGGSVDAVYCDSIGGGRMVADALVGAGHKRIAIVSGEEESSTSRDRETGFVDGLSEAGHRLWAREGGDFTYESGYRTARELLKKTKRPDGIFCVNDLMAMGALDCARLEMGIRIPQELSVIGFDDIPMASWPSYSLTTVRQPIDKLVDATIERLLTAMKSPGADIVTKKIQGSFVQRGSSRRVPSLIHRRSHEKRHS
jgi:LacI family transcriptional regulator